MSRTDRVLHAYKHLVDAMGGLLNMETGTPQKRREIDIQLRRTTEGRHPQQTVKAAEDIADEQDGDAAI